MGFFCGLFKKHIIKCDSCELDTDRWYVKDNKKYCRKCIIEKVQVGNTIPLSWNTSPSNYEMK